MTIKFSALASGALTVAALVFSGGAAAQSTVWDFGTPCDPSTCTANGVQASVQGAGSSGSNYVVSAVSNQGGNGLGYTSTGETTNQPDHAFDNRGGTNLGTTNEMLLINFGAAKVQLTAIAIGWAAYDTDISVLRWDGAGAPDLTTTAGPSALAGKGWTLVSSKDLDGSNTDLAASGDDTDRSFVLNTGVGANKNDAKVSSWWLISTYFGSTDATNRLEQGNDFFKILSFTGTICTTTVTGGSTGGGNAAGNNNGGTCGGGGGGGGATPEPGSMALAALGLLGAFGARRRLAKKA